jgi:hypothetical protein
MGRDAVNIGINPKIYKEERLAKIDLDRIQEAFDRSVEEQLENKAIEKLYTVIVGVNN